MALAICEANRDKPGFMIDAEEPSYTCPHCGKKVKLIWNVYVETEGES